MLTVDPEIENLVGAVPIDHLDRDSLTTARSWDITGGVVLSDAVTRRDVVVPRSPDASGEADLVIRIHRPVGIDGPLPCVYSIHGGGYVMGSFTMDDGRFDRWCPKYNCVGVSVEYRLAPETPYPGPLEDCYAGLKWVYEHADEIGVDAAHIGLCGASAGGGLAAALALLARDRDEIPLRFQLLDCPMLDDRQITPSSQLDGLYIFSRESNAFGWKSYLGDLYGTADIPAYASPARATDLRGLPPAYVCVGGVDGFRDEDIDYAQRLNQAGVPAELHVYSGAPHGVMMFGDVPIAKRYGAGIEDWIARQLRPTKV